MFGFAGLREEWIDKQSEELLEICTIITTEANAVLKAVHSRMPVILQTEDYDRWFNTRESELSIFFNIYNWQRKMRLITK